MSFETYETPFVSYSQAREDVVLVRALRDVPVNEAFYIDVGAYDANIDSVTRAFYDAGWRGINVEPSPDLMESFTRDRERDINLEVAVSSQPGELTFFENDNGQLGTLEERFAAPGSHRRIVPVRTLTQICEEHVRGPIHFLKIDVEGHERSVLEGHDFSRFRPWIMVIEAVRPNTHVPTYQEWEDVVLAAGYEFVLADAINRYYLANEKSELRVHFTMVADNFYQYRERWALIDAQKRVTDLERELAVMRRQLDALPELPASAPFVADGLEIETKPESAGNSRSIFSRLKSLFGRG